MKKQNSIGQLINKAENALALAIARGDVEAERKITRILEAAINSTDMPKVLA